MFTTPQIKGTCLKQIFLKFVPPNIYIYISLRKSKIYSAVYWTQEQLRKAQTNQTKQKPKKKEEKTRATLVKTQAMEKKREQLL